MPEERRGRPASPRDSEPELSRKARFVASSATDKDGLGG